MTGRNVKSETDKITRLFQYTERKTSIRKFIVLIYTDIKILAGNSISQKKSIIERTKNVLGNQLRNTDFQTTKTIKITERTD